MHSIIKHSIPGIYTSLIILGLTLCRHPGIAQNDASDKSKAKVTIGLTYYQFEKHNEIRVKVTARVDRKRRPVQGVSLEIYSISDTSDIFIDNKSTDENGVLTFEIDKEVRYFKNTDGEMEFQVRFTGDDQFRSSSKKLSARDVYMTIDFIEEDSIRYILASAYEINGDGDKILIENEDVYFYTPSSFSLLNLGDEELEEGQCMINFPVTLPGDSIGNVIVLARIEDSDDYGYVEIQSLKNWGVPREPVIIEKRRGLGDTDAPLWMVYTLIVLLSVVWFHYMYIMFVVYLIKKDGKKIVSSESG